LSNEAMVAPQFDDAGQQAEAARLGMWTFLATEVLFFGGLFAGYVVYRSRYPGAFATGSELLDVVLGAINTAVLITSSLTMAFAVRSASLRRRSRLVVFLLLTMLLGSIFLGIKGVEYYHKFEEGHVPGAHFHLEAENANHVELFFSFYFAMTGLHALHMIIGLGVLATLVLMLELRKGVPINPNTFEMTGLYWHFVDIVWIFLFPLLYLVARHQ
jgi:cytochrome c oxidase subunit 3